MYKNKSCICYGVIGNVKKSVLRGIPTQTTPQGTGGDVFNISTCNITHNIYTTYVYTWPHTILLLMLFVCLTKCILGIPSNCCPDDGLLGRNM